MCAEPSKLVVLDDLICRRFSEFESGAAGAKVLSSTGHWIGRQKTDGRQKMQELTLEQERKGLKKRNK